MILDYKSANIRLPRLALVLVQQELSFDSNTNFIAALGLTNIDYAVSRESVGISVLVKPAHKTQKSKMVLLLNCTKILLKKFLDKCYYTTITPQ